MTLDVKITPQLKKQMLEFAKKKIADGDITGEDDWVEFDSHWDINIYYPYSGDEYTADEQAEHSIVAYPTIRTGENSYSTLTDSWVVLKHHDHLYDD